MAQVVAVALHGCKSAVCCGATLAIKFDINYVSLNQTLNCNV